LWQSEVDSKDRELAQQRSARQKDRTEADDQLAEEQKSAAILRRDLQEHMQARLDIAEVRRVIWV
jgi:ribosomal protein S4